MSRWKGRQMSTERFTKPFLPPAVHQARKLGQFANARGVIVLMVTDEGQVAGASWGRDRADCQAMGRLLDEIVDGVDGGTLSRPWGTL